MEQMVYPLVLVMSMWVVYFFNLNYQLNLEQFGLQPHLKNGLIGILCMPLLHENLEHLFSNSIPLLVAGGFLFYYFKNLTWLIIGSIWIGGGIILWFIGETGTNHIGASGLVYGLVFFLLISGMLRGHRQLAAVALLMVFLYGSLIWGLFPEYARLLRENISWEGHLGGAIVGSIMAVALLKKGPKKDPIPQDDEDDEIDEFPYWLEDQNSMHNQNGEEPIIKKEEEEEKENLDSEKRNDDVEIKYRYVPKNANPWENTD